MKLRLGNWIGLSAIVVLVDQWTKHLVRGALRNGEVIRVTDYFDLVLAFNPGAAFSLLADQGGWQRYFFTAIALVAAVYIIYLLKKHAGQRMFCWALALILGGALGNAIDRLMYGHVVDFLDFHWKSWGHFPAFNIADSAICIGAALFIIDELRRVNK